MDLNQVFGGITRINYCNKKLLCANTDCLKEKCLAAKKFTARVMRYVKCITCYNDER